MIHSSDFECGLFDHVERDWLLHDEKKPDVKVSAPVSPPPVQPVETTTNVLTPAAYVFIAIAMFISLSFAVQVNEADQQLEDLRLDSLKMDKGLSVRSARR